MYMVETGAIRQRVIEIKLPLVAKIYAPFSFSNEVNTPPEERGRYARKTSRTIGELRELGTLHACRMQTEGESRGEMVCS